MGGRRLLGRVVASVVLLSAAHANRLERTEMMNCTSRVLSRRHRCTRAVLERFERGAESAARVARRAAAANGASHCVARSNRSQYHEDQLLVPLLLRLTAGGRGTFVELGALDGILFSNTYMMEVCFGWTGLLVEANPSNAAALARSGRRAVARHSAVCTPPQRSLMVTASGGAVSGSVETMSARFIKAWSSVNKPTERVEVPCAPLSQLMAEAGLATGATLLSLDVEGAEAAVLRTVNVALFQAVLVEMDGTSPAKDLDVHRILSAAGFSHAVRFDVPNSRVYLRPSTGTGTSAYQDDVRELTA